MSDFISKLAIGTAQFGMDYGISNQKGKVKEDEVEKILDLAFENGINTIDTAKAYGNSEEAIGNYLKKRPNNSWNIITKLSDTKTGLFDQIKDSNNKLTISPNIVMAHSADYFLDRKFQSWLSETKKDLSISKIGVSLYGENEISRVLKSDFKPKIIQMPLNILDTRLYRKGLLSDLNEIGIEIHARSVFLQGLFYLKGVELKGQFRDVVKNIKRLKTIAAKANLTLPELSLLWLVNLGKVTKIVLGVDNIDQLKVHLKTLKKKVESSIFEEALSMKYENEKILNPSLW